MSEDLTDLHLLRELEPVVESNLNRHLSMRKDWNPHDYIPWSDGQNYYALGGQDWDPEQSQLSEVAQAAMIQNLLTEDNLPSYHREIAMNFGMDGAWGSGSTAGPPRRTGTASRCATTSSSPARSTRSSSRPFALEQVTRGFSPGQTSRATCSPRACSTRSST